MPTHLWDFVKRLWLRNPYRLEFDVKRNRTSIRASLPKTALPAKWGFTLIELVIVFGIIASLFSTGIYVNSVGSLNRARDAQRARDLEQIKTAVELYYHDTNCFPPTTDVTFTSALSGGALWQEGGSIYMKKVPKDPAGTSSYIYKTDSVTCPQWMALFAKFTRPQTNFQACSMPDYAKSSPSCVPAGYDSTWGCVSSGNVTCNAPTPSTSPTPLPTSIPTPTPTLLAPAVTTAAATSITFTSAILNATINSNGLPTNYWWQYGTSNSSCSSLSTISDTGTINSGSASPSKQISGLAAGTNYWVCAVAQNSQGTTYGNVVSFSTTMVLNLAFDADHDGYYTGSASNQTATGFSLINGRTYYSTTTSGGAFSYLDPASALGANDCNDADLSVWQNLTGYQDADNDTYTFGGAQNVCSGVSLPSGWRSAPNGNDCNDSDATRWQYLTGYLDADGDTFTLSITGQVCSGTDFPPYNTTTNPYRKTQSSPLDCYDLNKDAKPGQTLYFTVQRDGGAAGSNPDSAGNTGDSYDYDCNGAQNMQYPSVCGGAIYSGWQTSVPACGTIGTFNSLSDGLPCYASIFKTQACK